MYLFLIDGKNALYRFGHAMRELKSKAGRPTGAVYGFADVLVRLKRKYPDSRFLVVWDGDKPSWRKREFPWYKAHRDLQAELELAVNGGDTRRQKEIAERIKIKQSILGQRQDVERLLSVMGVPLFYQSDLEADDLIGYFACKAHGPYDTVIYSSDKDFVQLVERGVNLIRGSDREHPLALETDRSIYRLFDCTASEIPLVRALCGDPSDEIPGAVKGLGPKTALKMVRAGCDPRQRKGWQPVIGLPKGEALRDHWADVERNYRLMKISWHMLDISEYLVEDFELFAGGRIAGAEYRELVSHLAELDLVEALENRAVLARIQS